MVSANSNSVASKFNYNGKELEEGLGLDWHDYGARNYDATLGRWMNIDPLADDYFNNSPYNYVANSPIIAYDPDGMRISIVGDDDYRAKVLYQLFSLALKSETGAKHLMDAINSERTLVIFDPSNEGDHAKFGPQGGGKTKKGEYETVGFDLSKANDSFDADNGTGEGELESNAMTLLGHELAHFNSPEDGKLLTEDGYDSGIASDEVYAVEEENKIRKELKMQQRTHYGGINVYGKTIKESKKYKGYHSLVNKKNYAKKTEGSINRGLVISHSFSVSTGIFEPFKRGGRFLQYKVRKPVPK